MHTPSDDHFDLDTAIAAWRRPFEAGGALSADDLEELERHLRDHVAALVACGWAEEDAFHQAVRKVGAYAATEAEYAKVFWPKAAAERRVLHELTWRLSMLKNYLTIAWRTLRRQRAYAAINVLGLGLGLAGCLLLALYVRHELSYDRFHANLDRLYRLVAYSGFAEKQWVGYVAGEPVAPMREVYDDVGDAVNVMPCGPERIEHDGEVFRDLQALCTEPSFFNLFSFDLVQGGPPKALAEPNTVVLTRSLADRLFGDADPVGQALSFPFGDDEQRPFRISGVMEDAPPNSHLAFDLLISYESLRSTNLCLHCGQMMYALLTPAADPDAVAARITQHVREVDGEEHVEEVRLEPVADIHFSDIPAGRQGDRRLVMILGAIAIVLLAIACANCMNLATARYAHRTREVGVRKALGARRGQIARQFLLEALLVTLLAFPLALLLAALGLPLFNSLAQSEMALSAREDGPLLLAGLGLLIVVGLIAGSYPALFLSGFRPDAVLRGRPRRSLTAAGLRQALVVFQFVVGIGMVALTGVVLAQLRFVQERGLGFEEEGVVLVRVAEPALAQSPETLKEESLRLPRVEAATAGSGMPGERRFHWRSLTHRFDSNGDPSQYAEDGDATVTFQQPAIDDEFVETMGLRLIAGRNVRDVRTRPKWEEGMEMLKTEALLNRSAARALGWTPEEAVGQTLGWDHIVGVVDDFHFQSLHQEIAPLMMAQNVRGGAGTIALRVSGEDVGGTIEALRATWARLAPQEPFDFAFLSDEWAALYEKEQRAARIFGWAAGLAVGLAALGLFGLAAFAAERRTKEIGIRKALGATVASIVALLFRETAWLLVAAFALAAPLAYLAAERWLEAFAFRIELGPAVFLVAGALALLIAFSATALQSIRAARRNPVEALRYE